jgi:hypothetical protein
MRERSISTTPLITVGHPFPTFDASRSWQLNAGSTNSDLIANARLTGNRAPNPVR